MRQLALFFPLDKHGLRTFLEKAINKTVSLVITDNSKIMLSAKKDGKNVLVRLHRIFLSAGTDVLDEIADYIKDKKKKTPHVRSFIKQNIHCLKKRPPRRVTIQPRGRYYNLLDIYNLINREYFEGRVSAVITWGTKSSRRAARKRTLGSYSRQNNTIRINPILDTQKVPGYFLESIVYHEMLHADMPIETGTGKRLLHSSKFKRREKLFKHYNRVLAWEKKNM